VFIYTCSQIDKPDAQLMLEAEIYYDYLKKYKPVCILKKIAITDPLDIDKHVKQYMIEYGIDHVRGGSYCDEELPEYLEKTLIHELDTFINSENIKRKNIIENIIQKYAYKQMTKTDIQEEKERLKTIFEKYAKEKEEYDTLYGLFENNISAAVTKEKYANAIRPLPYKNNKGSQIIEDIHWLKTACSQNLQLYNEKKQGSFLYKRISNENNEKYKQILVSLKNVYNTFTNLQMDKMDKYDHMCIKYPQFILDDFFYHWHRIHLQKSVEDMEEICHIYEYMTNILINKMEEKRFDVSSWGENIEWELPRILYILHKIGRASCRERVYSRV
jgi:hypothetical protein